MNLLDKTICSAPIFAALSEREFDLIRAQATIIDFCAQQILFYEHEKVDYWYILLKGEISLYKTDANGKNISIKTVQRYAPINEVRQEGESYEAYIFSSAVAVYDGSAIGVRASALPLLFAQIPSFAVSCLNLSLCCSQAYQKSLYQNIILDATGKVAYLIARDVKKFNTMKKQEIAQYLNIQPETLSRVLAKLCRKEAIRIEKEIEIVDLSLLESLYEL